MLPNFLDECKISKLAAYQAASTTDIDSSRVDMTGFDSVVFMVFFGDVVSGSVLELQVFQNTADSTSSPTPVEVTNDSAQITAGTSNMDNKCIAVAVHKHDPSKGKYLYAHIVIDTQNAPVDNVIAIQYNPRSVPVTQVDAVVSAFLHPAG